MSRSLLSALLLASLAPFVLPSGAGAETLCAHQPAGCTGAAYTTVQAALDAAATLPGRDRVEVGEHAGGAGETIDIAPGNAVDVVGVGADASILAAGATPILIREPSAVVRDLQLVARDPATRLVDLEAGTLQDVGLVPRGATAVALRLGAGTLRRVKIADLGRYGDALDTGIVADGAGGTLEDVDITARVGLESSATALALTRVQVVAEASAVQVTGGGLTADDSEFVGNEEAVPVFDVTPAAATAVTLRSTTVSTWGEPGSVGIEAACTGATADVHLVDVLAIGSERDLVRSGAGCAMALDHVGYGARDAGGGAFSDGPGVLSGSMEPFTDGADFHAAPGWASPAHDAGSARPVAAGETDLAGHPRVVDAARDLGALEYQHRPPAIERVEGPDGAIAVGDEAGFAAFAEDPDGEWPSYAWTLDGMPVAQAFPEYPELGSDFYEFAFTPVTSGPHTIGVTVTDPSGLTATRTVVLPVGAAPGGSVPEPPPSPPIVAPVIVKPKAPAAPSLAIDRHDRTVGRRDHRLAIALTCGQATRCSGSVRIVLRGKRKVNATLGPAAFAIAAHTTKTIRLTVPAKVVTALRTAKGATATVTTWHGPKATGQRWATATIEVRA